ncbi:exo-beta-N-acetylmuramidase NamZ domain-containing protein [Aureliella helgolandensis]|uniref:Esterase EstB n=1 Tax=Aureliella helgolandensis TaxID=2527968 RepID=A0A518G7L5_9BACT|nr:exo-beta-N-acetylmuramidase NamZ domain-containing protein [Aureliella helgolandensis]QDV24575.1 Esterase EstB [Aureliella helgolandensis]
MSILPRYCLLFLFFVSQCLCSTLGLAETLPLVSPSEVGLDGDALVGIEAIVEEGIENKKMPGCVVCVGRHGKIAYLEAFGNKQVEPSQVSMTTDTVFDMASITKPVATATSVMKLVEQGKIRLGAKVVEYFPEFAPNGKDDITVKDLLIHQSGLIPDNSLKDYLDGPELAWQRICDLGLVAPVGTTFKYSDVNFIVLAKLVEKVSGKDINEFSQENLFTPLGMSESGYLPRAELQSRAAPTEERDGAWMQGQVHDPRAHALGGVAGHAGLFSTAQDLAIYAQMMLQDGSYSTSEDQTVRVLSPLTVATMTRGYAVSSGVRGLGWDKKTGYSSNRGDLLTEAAFGHGGFTGTVLWIDPELDLFFIFLSNRVHPTGSGSVNHLAGSIVNLVAGAITDVESTSQAAAGKSNLVETLTGLDVLQRDQFSQLAGQRVGLITNHTGRNRSGESIVQLFHKAEQVNLAALFSPEHGFEGKLDVERIGDAADATTGLTIHSLYGETRKPTEAMVKDLDVLVFDIQDIGTRFYTYISTMGEAMRAASEYGKRFVVLDRPNPINGVQTAGPMLDAGYESFVGFHHLPVRHGMTIGEIAQMLKSELELDVDLQVIGCEQWNRQDYWEATNLTWVNPSPNMRSLVQALLYPGVGLLEMTNVSVGRGTDTPFEVLGAPWIRGQELAQALNSNSIPGVVFVPIEFRPESSKYEGELCSGVNILITDRDAVDPLRIGIELACQLRHAYPEEWETKNLNRLLGNRVVTDAIIAGTGVEQVMTLAAEGLESFEARRRTFLLYPLDAEGN